MFIHIFREFCIYGQINNTVLVFTPSRQLNRKLNRVSTSQLGLYIGIVLVGRKDLFQQHGQLHLSYIASQLDVAQDFFKATNIGCKGLHFSQSFLHTLQLLAHHFKRLSQPFIQGFLKFLINSFSHLVQPLFCTVDQQLYFFRLIPAVLVQRGPQFKPVLPGQLVVVFAVHPEIFTKRLFDAAEGLFQLFHFTLGKRSAVVCFAKQKHQ